MSQELERVYTINLGKVKLSQSQHRAVRAINMIREFARHHMKVETIKIEEELAQQIWARGVRSPPRKIRVRMSKTDEGYVLVSQYDEEVIESKAVTEIETKKIEDKIDDTQLSKEYTPLKIIDIEGIGPTYAEKLESIGIKTSADLLEKGKTPQGRKEISNQSELSDKLILKWVNMADLIRIKGVGEEYSELLEVSGVDTVVELSHRNAVNLHKKMQEVSKEKNLVRKTPTLNDVENWIAQAKTLPRAIEY